MQKMVRPDCPQCLQDKSSEWNQAYCARREDNPAAGFRWPQWQGEPVNHILRVELSAATQGHCSYCDGGFPMGSASRDTIDHFRPKETFCAEAFDWGNLYLCCDCCQQCKGSRYSDKLLRPDADDFDFFHYFYLKHRNGEIDVSPLLTDAEQREQARQTIRIFGLNKNGRPYARLAELQKYSALTAAQQIERLDTYNYRFILRLATHTEGDA